VCGQVLNSLLAGVYLAFVVAVMPALHGLADDTFRTVMHRIDVAIVNPAFLTLFPGAARSPTAGPATRTRRRGSGELCLPYGQCQRGGGERTTWIP